MSSNKLTFSLASLLILAFALFLTPSIVEASSSNFNVTAVTVSGGTPLLIGDTIEVTVQVDSFDTGPVRYAPATPEVPVTLTLTLKQGVAADPGATPPTPAVPPIARTAMLKSPLAAGALADITDDNDNTTGDLVFTYTIQQGDTDTDGIAIGGAAANSLLGQAAITGFDQFTDNNAVEALEGDIDNWGSTVLADLAAIRIDAP